MPAANRAHAVRLVIGIWLAFAACLSSAQAIDAAVAKNPDLEQTAVKLQADPETQAAMEAIRRRVINVHTLITHRRMPVAGASQFARETEADVARVAHSRVAAGIASDPMSPILKKITDGAASIAHPRPERGQIDGLVDVVSGLETYAATFNHPGWRSLQQQ